MGIADTMFQASDLAGSRRREFIGAGRSGCALLRDTDGFALVMLPLAKWEAVREIAGSAMTMLRAEAAVRRPDVRPADLEPLAWLVQFDADDQGEFFEEFRDALAQAASSLDLDPVRACLRDWETTARALSDPTRRAILTTAGDNGYEEVGPPS